MAPRRNAALTASAQVDTASFVNITAKRRSMVLAERSGMLTYTALDLVLAQGRVEKAIAHVSRQREIIDEFQARGHPAGPALELLEQFELSLQQHRQHVETIRQDLLRLSGS